jgi:hypothetical protein
MSFSAITLRVASQLVFIIYFVIDSVRELLDTPSYIDISAENMEFSCLCVKTRKLKAH